MKTGTVLSTSRLDHSLEGQAPLKVLAQICLIAPVIALSWWFGGVQAGHQRWLFIGLFVGLALFLVRSFSRRAPSMALPTAIVPMSLALLLGLWQLVPLPGRLLGQVAPRNLSIWRSMLPDDVSPAGPGSQFSSGQGHLGDAGREFAGELSVVDESQAGERELSFELGAPTTNPPATISLNPGSSRHDLALLAAAVGAFFLANRILSTTSGALVLFTIVALNGAALSFFGLAQQLQWNGLLFGSIPLSEGGAPFASFVNRNSGAGFLNMCLGGSIGLTVWLFARRPEGAELPARHADSTSRRPLLSQLSGSTIAALTLTALIFAGVVCSMSRGGWFSALIAALLAVGLTCLIHKAWKRAMLLMAATALGLLLVGWVGRMELVEQRLGSVFSELGDDSRWEHWENGLSASADFPVFGSGLGTYRYVYKLYERNGSQSWFYHAENQYLEALVEAGAVGLTLMLSAIGFVLIACWRLLQQPTSSPEFACGVGGLYALATQAVHAATDFGLYLPANMALLAVLCGAICGVAARTTSAASPSGAGHRLLAALATGRHPAWLVLPRIHALPVSFGTFFAFAMVLGGLKISNTERVETALRMSRLEAEPEATTVPVLDDQLAKLAAVTSYDSDASEAWQRLGQLWIHRYRLEALAALQKERPATDVNTLWDWTSTVNLHRRTHELIRNDPNDDLRRLRRARDVRTNLAHAARALLAARRACPLLVKPHLLLAEIEPAISESADGELSLQRAVRLATGDYDLLLECGLLEAQAGRGQRACAVWRRAMEILPERFGQILSLAAGQDGVRERLVDLVPDSPELMIQVARKTFLGADQQANRYELADRAYQLLGNVERFELDQREYLMGAALALWDKQQVALEHYQRALQLRPEQTEWRYELAMLLEATGRLDQAEHHATVCAQMEPNNEQYVAFQQHLMRRKQESEPFDRQNPPTDNDTSVKVRQPAEYSLVEIERRSRLES